MNLAVDLGNTRAKAGVFEREQLVESLSFSREEELLAFIHTQQPDGMIISSVSRQAQTLSQKISDKIPRLIFEPTMPLPLTNLYGTPQTLGADRLAAVVGARQFRPQGACLVIDAGTCITYDVLTAEDEYLGGAISPGLEMRFKALHTFTARLPQEEAVLQTPLTGSNTRESIRSGIIHGTAAELEGMIRRYAEQWPSLQILICGGNAKFFESKIKADIFVVSELVLIGLNKILRYNDPKLV